MTFEKLTKIHKFGPFERDYLQKLIELLDHHKFKSETIHNKNLAHMMDIFLKRI